VGLEIEIEKWRAGELENWSRMAMSA